MTESVHARNLAETMPAVGFEKAKQDYVAHTGHFDCFFFNCAVLF